MENVKFYAACLASYNSGILHGAWIDASDDKRAMQEEINAMLRASPEPNVMVDCPDCDAESRADCATCKGAGRVPSAEEWAIHDYEGLPKSFGEYCGLDKIADYMAFLSEVEEQCGDKDAVEVAQGLIDYHGGDISYSAQMVENFCGIYESFQDYADELAAELIACENAQSDFLQRYFDYQAFARDLDFDVTQIDLSGGRVAVFNN